MKIVGFLMEDGSIVKIECFSKVTINPKGDNTDYVLNVIKAHRVISREHLTQKTRKITTRERNYIVDALLAKGFIVADKRGKKINYVFVEEYARNRHDN